MQAQFNHVISEISDGQTKTFDLIVANSTFRNATAFVFPYSSATYTIYVYYDDIEYTDLRTSRTSERSMDVFLLTPDDRYFLPTVTPGLPGQYGSKPFVSIPIRIAINNATGSAVTFFVGVTWEVSPPRGSW